MGHLMGSCSLDEFKHLKKLKKKKKNKKGLDVLLHIS